MRFKLDSRSVAKAGRCLEIKNSPWFRSRMERNCFRALKLMYPKIEYESFRFTFPEPYRRCIDYLPDFIDPLSLTIFEAKGWLDGKSKTKLLGFKKHYPDRVAKLVVITGKSNHAWIHEKIGCQVWDYLQLKRQAAGLVVWE